MLSDNLGDVIVGEKQGHGLVEDETDVTCFVRSVLVLGSEFVVAFVCRCGPKLVADQAVKSTAHVAPVG